MHDLGLDRQLAAAITLRDQVEYVQPNDAPALLQELIPVIHRLLSDITPQFMETPEHVCVCGPVTDAPLHDTLTGMARVGGRTACPRNCAMRCSR